MKKLGIVLFVGGVVAALWGRDYVANHPIEGFVALLGGDYTYTMASRMQKGGLIMAVVGLALSLIGVIRGPKHP